MKRIALAISALALSVASAIAQVIPPGTNPIPVGGAYNSSAPTCVSGSGCWFQVDVNGNLKIAIASGGLTGSTSNASSGVATSATNLPTVAYNYAFNGTTWDQVRSKAASTAAVATDPSLVTQLNPNSPGIVALGQTTKANSVPVTFASDSGPAAVANALPFTLSSQYPTNATTTAPTPITGNATGTTGAVVGTLAAAASVTTHICGFNVSTAGGVASIGPITVAGLVGSSMVFQLFSTATGANLTQTFNPCIPASAANTAITITTTADGTASAVDVNSWGYRL